MNSIQRYFQEHDRSWVLSLVFASFLIYLPFLGNPFFFDDFPLLSGDMLNRYAHEHAMFHFDLRWFTYVTLAWTAVLFSDVVPHFFHLGNLLLHAATTITLFYLLRQIIGAVSSEAKESPTLIRGAWIAALIFALHPVAVYAVGYVIQRSIVMATLFVLLMQMAYLRGLLTGQVRWLALAVLCYFLAVFSKEHTVLAPAVLAMLTFLLREKNIASKRSLWLTWAAFFAVAVLITLLVTLPGRGVLGRPYEEMAAGIFVQQGIVASAPMLHLQSVLTQAGLFFKYLFLWFLPNVSWMSVDMREPFIATWTDWRGWFALFAFVVYGFVGVRLLLRGGNKGLIGFALLYPWVQFGVELVGIRVQEPFVLYRSYLWMSGLTLLIPLLLLRFPQQRTVLILCCVAIMLAPLAWNRMWVFGDNFRLWNDAALLLKDERTAGADRIYFNRGQALMDVQKWQEAASDFERTIAISPQLELPHLLLGEVYIKAGRNTEALGQFDMALAIKDDNWAYFYKGIALMLLHRNFEAKVPFEQSCRLNNYAACLLISVPQKKL